MKIQMKIYEKVLEFIIKSDKKYEVLDIAKGLGLKESQVHRALIHLKNMQVIRTEKKLLKKADKEHPPVNIIIVEPLGGGAFERAKYKIQKAKERVKNGL